MKFCFDKANKSKIYFKTQNMTIEVISSKFMDELSKENIYQ